MILPSCHCTAIQNPGPHHPHCPAVAEPQPLDQTQASAHNAYTQHFIAHNIARAIVFLKNDDGSSFSPSWPPTSTPHNPLQALPSAQMAHDAQCTHIPA